MSAHECIRTANGHGEIDTQLRRGGAPVPVRREWPRVSCIKHGAQSCAEVKTRFDRAESANFGLTGKPNTSIFSTATPAVRKTEALCSFATRK